MNHRDLQEADTVDDIVPLETNYDKVVSEWVLSAASQAAPPSTKAKIEDVKSGDKTARELFGRVALEVCACHCLMIEQFDLPGACRKRLELPAGRGRHGGGEVARYGFSSFPSAG